MRVALTGTSPLYSSTETTETSEAGGNIYARRGRLNGSKLEKRKRRGGVAGGVGRACWRCDDRIAADD